MVSVDVLRERVHFGLQVRAKQVRVLLAVADHFDNLLDRPSAVHVATQLNRVLLDALDHLSQLVVIAALD